MNEARAEQNLVEPRTESNVKFELSKELLTELQSNTYSGRVEEDVIGHIAKVLEILNLIKIACMDPFQLRMTVFPLSLSGDARKWWMNEGDGKITTWKELVKKFFKKFYPLSYASNYDKMCDNDDEGRDPLEFIPWMNSKFKDHKKVDETTKRALLNTWIEVGNEEGLMNDEVSSDEEWEEHEYGNPPNTNNNSFPKPYLNTNNEGDKGYHKKNNSDTSKLENIIPSGAPHSEELTNEQLIEKMCKVEKFEVIKYSVGDNEEFLAICTHECNSWARIVNGVSSIYHDIFRKKDEGWTIHRTK
ncbi:hypothetical protein Tco_0374848 [Tanacetum coccineum]